MGVRAGRRRARGTFGRMGPDLYPDLKPLAFLLGTWEGGGEGRYPTVSPFAYRESLSFEHVGDDFLMYAMDSWSVEDGEPLHFERGFLRPGASPEAVELTLAHPLGLVEISDGTLDGTSLELRSSTVGRTRTGSAVTGVARRYRVEGDVLRYELDMAMEGVPMTRHLDGELHRVSS
jgi:hypothetical protein